LSILMAVLVPGLLLIIGLAVDGGAKVQATQRANAIADEAARAGGQALDRSAALTGDVRVDVAAAVAAAQDYLDRNDVPGTVTVVDADTLAVTTTITEPTVLLGLIGIDTLTVDGSGTADLVTDPAVN
jgi:Flp pilus assembly protein TadG